MTVPQSPDVLWHYAELAQYRDALDAYLAGRDESDGLLRHTGAALCKLAKHRQVSPEHLLLAIRAGRDDVAVHAGDTQLARVSQVRSRRMTHALDLLLACYFSAPSQPTTTG